jgi:hypothetical protein
MTAAPSSEPEPTPAPEPAPPIDEAGIAAYERDGAGRA